MYAMFFLPFEYWICLLLAIGLAFMVAVGIVCRQRQCHLLLSHSDDGWALRSRRPAQCLSGSLVQAGYRSSWLIILAIQSDDTALHRVTIWRDQVSSRQFSYLHQQLAFAAEPPARRRPGLWLRDCVGMQPATSWHHRTRGDKTLRKQTRSPARNTLD